MTRLASPAISVRNDGSASLTLADISTFTLPAGYSVINGWSNGTVLAGGAATSFTVRLNATAAGSYNGQLSFSNGDSDENPFNFTLQGTVASAPPAPVVQIIDNRDSGFALAGAWTPFDGSVYYAGDMHYAAAGGGGSTATWTFTIQPGQYRISSTWYAHPNRATNAPYQVLNGATLVGSAVINQELPPNDLNDAGSAWEDLGVFTISGNTLVVRLSDAANEYVIADAIRIERVGALPSLSNGLVASSIVLTENASVEANSSASDILVLSANQSLLTAATPLAAKKGPSSNALPITNNATINTTSASKQRELAIDRSIAQFDWIDSLDLPFARLKRR